MLDLHTTVADIVLDHSECVPVFQRHRIDFCCRGGLPLAQACKERGVDAQKVLADLEQAVSARGQAGDDDARRLSTEPLLDRIVQVHHQFLRDALPTVGALAHKVARVHGGGAPHLRQLERLVRDLIEELEPHIDHEERVLFPMIRDAKADRAELLRELTTMGAEHDRVGELLASIRDITSDFTPPPGACNSYRALFSELAAVESDVMRHVHLENHVLRPRFTQS